MEMVYGGAWDGTCWSNKQKISKCKNKFYKFIFQVYLLVNVKMYTSLSGI